MTSTTIKRKISWWDMTGIFFSSLCLVHCVVTPILLVSASLLPIAEWLHVAFFIPLIPITFMASRHTYRSGGKRWPILLLVAGLTMLGAALVVGVFVGETAEIMTTVAGSVLLIAGHLSNKCLYTARKG